MLSRRSLAAAAMALAAGTTANAAAHQVLTPAQAATQLLRFNTVDFATVHVSGVNDRATASWNIRDTANGYAATRSAYGTAPGGAVWLSGTMLRALLKLARDGWRFRVSEIAGGSHSVGSTHYAGISVDIDRIGTVPISASHPSYRRFLQACRTYGANEIYQPGDPGHDTHIHVGWR